MTFHKPYHLRHRTNIPSYTSPIATVAIVLVVACALIAASALGAVVAFAFRW
jgi:hypothetical protein